MKKLILLMFLFLIQENVHAQYSYLPANKSLCDDRKWIQVFRDDFDGSSLNSINWVTYRNDGLCYNQNNDDCPASRIFGRCVLKDENVVVSNGTCKLIMKNEPSTWKGQSEKFSSGMIAMPDFDQRRLYFNRGKFVARIKMAGMNKAATNFWLWASKYKGHNYEIDVAEYDASKPKRMTFSLHNSASSEGDFTHWYEKKGSGKKINWSNDFHVYMVDWDENFITFYVDGYLVETRPRLKYDLGGIFGYLPYSSCNTNAGNYDVIPGFFHVNAFSPAQVTLTMNGDHMYSKACTTEIDYIMVFQRADCEEDYVMTNSELFPRERLSSKTITLGTQGLPNNWSNIVPQWEGKYEAEAITILPNFESYPVYHDRNPNTASPNWGYSATTFIARTCPGYSQPPVYYEEPEIDEAAIWADTLRDPCTNVDTVYLDSLIGVATIENDTALLNEIHAYLDTLECDWWPVISGNRHSMLKKAKVGNEKIKVYPNPNRGVFMVSFPSVGDYSIVVTDIVGVVVFRTFLNQEQEVNIELDKKLPPGNYIINISGSGIQYKQRISIIQ